MKQFRNEISFTGSQDKDKAQKNCKNKQVARKVTSFNLNIHLYLWKFHDTYCDINRFL